jgi:hypothetical protein
MSDTVRAPWEYGDHTITVNDRGYFQVDGDGSWPTMDIAREQIDKILKHREAVKKEPMALAVLTLAGAAVTVTGIGRNNSEYLTSPKVEVRYGSTPEYFVDTPTVRAKLKVLQNAAALIKATEGQLAPCRLLETHTDYHRHIDPEAYPLHVARAKANYAKALEAAAKLEGGAA